MQLLVVRQIIQLNIGTTGKGNKIKFHKKHQIEHDTSTGRIRKKTSLRLKPKPNLKDLQVIIKNRTVFLEKNRYNNKKKNK